MRRWMLVAALTLAACGDPTSTAVPDASSNSDAGSPFDAGGGCDGVGREVPDEGAQHAPSELDGGYFYASQPPASGNHYPTPAAWGVYTVPVARERRASGFGPGTELTMCTGCCPGGRCVRNSMTIGLSSGVSISCSKSVRPISAA